MSTIAIADELDDSSMVLFKQLEGGALEVTIMARGEVKGSVIVPQQAVVMVLEYFKNDPTNEA